VSNSDVPARSALAARIRDEMADLDGVARRALDAWPRAQTPSADQHAYLDSVALNVHGLYSGVERLLELIAR
jgi:hypothetical protein